MSMEKIIFHADSMDIAIDPPLFGYTTNIKLPFEIAQLDSGSYSIYDMGKDESPVTKYDKRECICNFELSQQESASLNNFIQSTRGQQVNIILPSESGCYFAGPDKGDSGTFNCTLESVKHEGMKNEPFRYFGDKIHIKFIGEFPEYEFPAEVGDGTFAIGSVSDLRFPEAVFDPDQMYAYYTQLTESSDLNVIDRGSLADQVTTQFTQKCNNSKAVALINELTTVIRSNQTSITAQNKQFPFGIQHGDNEVFNVLFIQDTISIKHNKFNEFEFSLKFFLNNIG